MDIKKELGEKIKKLRKKHGLTQEQLAELIDISSRNISNIELGVSFVKADTFEKILEAFNITAEQLFENSHIKTNHELIKDIDNLINSIKNDTKMLKKVHKILKYIIEET